MRFISSRTMTPDGIPIQLCEQTRSANRWPFSLSSGVDLTFDRSGTGDAGRRASRVPSLPFGALIAHLLPAIPDGGRWAK